MQTKNYHKSVNYAKFSHKYQGEQPFTHKEYHFKSSFSFVKVHVIFSYKGKNHLIKKDIRCKDDVYTHLYTLIVKPDNTYEVLIDNEKVESGELEADWDFLPPKKIKVRMN